MGIIKRKKQDQVRQMPTIEDKKALHEIVNKKLNDEKSAFTIHTIIKKCHYDVDTTHKSCVESAKIIIKLINDEIEMLKHKIEREKLIQEGISYGATFDDLNVDMPIRQLKIKVDRYAQLFKKAQHDRHREEKMEKLMRDRDIDLFRRGMLYEFSMKDTCHTAYKVHFQLIHLQAKMNQYAKKVRALHSTTTMPLFKFKLEVEDLYNQVHELEKIYANKEKSIVDSINFKMSPNNPLYDEHLRILENEARTQIKKNFHQYNHEAMKLIESVDKYNQHAFAYILTLKHQIEDEKHIKKQAKKNKAAKMHKKAKKVSIKAEKKWHKTKQKAK